MAGLLWVNYAGTASLKRRLLPAECTCFCASGGPAGQPLAAASATRHYWTNCLVAPASGHTKIVYLDE